MSNSDGTQLLGDLHCQLSMYRGTNSLPQRSRAIPARLPSFPSTLCSKEAGDLQGGH